MSTVKKEGLGKRMGIGVATTISVAILMGVGNVMLNTLVFASDLEPIRNDIREIHADAKNTRVLLVSLQTGQRKQTIRYLNDQIIMLEVTSTERNLTPTEMQRLLYYRVDLTDISKL